MWTYGFGYSGLKFTLYMIVTNNVTAWERLDRAMRTMDWFSIYLAFQVMPLECSSSDLTTKNKIK